MRRFKIACILGGLVFAGVAIVLLLNFTAPNPTGRRYSSQMPLIEGLPTTVGESAENILSTDLGVLRNTSAKQRQCLCQPGEEQPPTCLSCAVHLEMNLQENERFRIPDFITSRYIAEAKNSRQFPGNSREAREVQDYIKASQLLNRPLFLYVRMDTKVSSEWYSLIGSTGGGVVHYFTVPGWVDPVDEGAKIALGVGVGMFLLGLLMPIRLRAHYQTPVSPNDPLSTVTRKIDDVDDFVARAKNRERFEIDVEDSRLD